MNDALTRRELEPAGLPDVQSLQRFARAASVGAVYEAAARGLSVTGLVNGEIISKPAVEIVAEMERRAGTSKADRDIEAA